MFLVIVTIYVVVVSAVNLERLRIDEKGIRVRPAGRIPWEHRSRASPTAARTRSP